MAVVGEPQRDHAVVAVARGEHFVSEIFVVGDKDRSPLDSQVEYAVIIGASLKIEYGNHVVSRLLRKRATAGPVHSSTTKRMGTS